MNVKETYDFLQALIQDLNNRDLERHELLIWTDERGIAGQKGVGVKSLHIGFDWYDRKIIITPDKPLVPFGTHRDIPKKPWKLSDLAPWVQRSTTICCPNCEFTLSKHTWQYCPKCGQKLDWSKDYGKAK